MAVGLLTLAPVLAAIWLHPGFVTQDGPAHLYNAHVLARSFDETSAFGGSFSVRWDPLPNWAGHLALMTLVSVLPARTADRVMTTATLAGLAAAIIWLRWRVANGRGIGLAAVVAAGIAANVTWLLGFSSFLLGACVFSITLGAWWSWRDLGWSARRAGALAALMVLGYFCHVVSLGVTALSLAVLALLTPARSWLGRAATTSAGILPLVPLAGLYLGLMRRGGGGLDPEWKHLVNPLSPRAWLEQLSWSDPVSLARRDVVPLVDGVSSEWFALFAPVVWLAVGLGLAIVATLAIDWDKPLRTEYWHWRAMPGFRPPADDPQVRERRGWWVLAFLLLIGGSAGPDTLGASHGEYLQQRLVLLGLVALVPALRLDPAGRIGRVAAVALIGALMLQSAMVWDYARTSERTAGAILRAAGAVGTDERIAMRLTGIRTRFRANPLLHADGLLGIGTGNILWGDYETRFYYFPVRFTDGLNRPDPYELERIALMDRPEEAAERAQRWRRLLERYHDAIDVVVAWGDDPPLDTITAQWYRLTYADGPVRVFRGFESR
jgi:hypothetical protein